MSILGLMASVSVGAASMSAAVAAPDPSDRPTSLPLATSTRALSTPVALAGYGGAMFVVNRGASTVTEVNGSAGAWTRTISAAAGRFSSPDAIAVVGPDLFVANSTGSLSEIDARTGHLVRYVTGTKYGFSVPVAIAVRGADLFVLNAGGSVTEIDATSGAWIRTVAGARYGFNHPSAVAVAGGQVWVTNRLGNSITEFDATTGSWTRTLNGPAYQLQGPSGIAFDGTRLWVTDSSNAKITVVTVATGAAYRVFSASAPGPAAVVTGDVRVYVASPAGSSPMITAYAAQSTGYQWMMCNSNAPYNFNNPQAMLVVGADLWIANAAGNSLTEMNAITGDYLQRLA